jgi:hypothetical protein
LLAAGYDVVGFDNERHVYGEARYPAQLVLQDVLTLHGSQFKGAALIVASPPCQEYSYMAMPWSRAKAIQAEYRSGARDVKNLTRLFDACFRIQREACEAAGRHIPLVVENVRGAQKWVGRARWNFGSFYLWGDVPALMPMTKQGLKLPGNNGPRLWADREVQSLCDAGTKNSGGSWFNVAHNTTSGKGQNPDGRRLEPVSSASETSPQTGDGVKHHASGAAWFDGAPDKMLGHCGPEKYSSKSSARKAASAMIAKIPFELARHIAQSWKPTAA